MKPPELPDRFQMVVDCFKHQVFLQFFDSRSWILLYQLLQAVVFEGGHNIPAWSFTWLRISDQNLANYFCLVRTFTNPLSNACCVGRADSVAVTPKRKSKSARALKWLFCMATSNTCKTASSQHLSTISLLYNAAQNVL